MPHWLNVSRAFLIGAVVSLAGFAGPAHAGAGTDPQPGEDVAPPVNINIAMLYNIFQNANSFGGTDGSGTIGHQTRFVYDIVALRYIRTLEVAGFEGGVQAYVPYIGFIGNQSLGINASALTFGEPAYARLAAKTGIGQPNLSAFFWPYQDAAKGDYLVNLFWLSPPVSSFDKDASLNPGQNVWTYELEAGARDTFWGTPDTQNVALSLWASGYMYGQNSSSAYVVPDVVIPAFGVTAPGGAFAATFKEQPTLELRAYLPYQFYPATRAFIAPGFYQSFGGKQTYALHGGGSVDSGNRTNETQLRLLAGTFISPTTQLLVVGDYDIRSHGEPLYRTFEMRVTMFF